MVSSGIEFENYELAKAEILRQLEDCRAGRITAEELEQARASLLSGLRSALDQPAGVDEFYLGQAILGLSETMEDRMAAIRAVTADEVAAAARRLTLDTVYFLKGVAS